MQYGGFWRRLAAYIIDALIMFPIGWCALWLGMPSTQWFLAIWLIPGLVLSLAYNVWLVSRFGGTPGLLLMKLRIRMLDGSPVTLRAAAIRYSVLFILVTILAIAGLISALRINPLTYHGMTFMQLAVQLALHQPFWNGWVTNITNLWIGSEFIVLLFNEKRRAIQDFMAGTVVVKRDATNLVPSATLPASGPAQA